MTVSLMLSACALSGTAWAAGPQRDALVAFSRTPLHFEANRGQWGQDVRFLARGPGYALFLTDEGPALRLLRSGGKSSAPRAALVRMRLPGAVRATGIEPASRLGGVSHHYLGADRAHWHTGQEHFARVTYRQVYPGIDVSYYGNQRKLEYDFLVGPGADPARIRMRFDGARKVALERGELVLDTSAGRVVQRAPVAYQELEGGRREVSARFELRGREARFRLGAYDRTRALVIDPVLVYATYLGGEETAQAGPGEEVATAVAVDPAGSAVVVGSTSAVDFPLSSPHQDDNLGYRDVFVSRFTPAGDALVFSTYLGGNDNDAAYGVALDPSGNVYVTGATASFNFPTLSAYQATNGGPCCLSDAFVASLSPAGVLRYSTYVGGYSDDRASGIAVNSAGEATIAGATYSDDYPVTVGAFQATRAGVQDAFVTRLAASGSSLLASTYLGGGSYDVGTAVALDGTGNAYVAGGTSSINFPTLNPYQGAMNGASGFVTKLNPALSALGFSTCLGGSGEDSVLAIALDAAGRPCVAGETTSTDFPTLGALQGNQPGGDGFVTLFTASGSALAFSTYLGGNGNDTVRALALDAAGAVHVAGSTASTDFPTLNAVQGDQPGQDAFVAKLAPNGSRLISSTYLGGSGSDLGYYAGLALGPTGDVYVAGATASTDFPSVNPFQATRVGSWDAFVARLQSLAKGDFDRNGQADLLFHNTVTGENQAWPLDGVTLSGAPATITPAAPSLAWSIEGVDDFDGDERSDLVFRDQTSGATELWLMNGAARVGAPVPLAGALVPPWRLSATADFDRDGRPDLLWRNYATQKLSIWTMNGTTQLGTLTPTPDQALDGNWEVAAALDYNGDSYTDLLWYNWSSGKIVLWFMDQNVQRITGQFTNPSNAGNANWKVLAGGDYGVGPGGLAGTKDIVWRNSTSGKVVVWYMDRAGNRTSGVFTSPDAPSPVPTDWTIAGPR